VSIHVERLGNSRFGIRQYPRHGAVLSFAITNKEKRELPIGVGRRDRRSNRQFSYRDTINLPREEKPDQSLKNIKR
tara:strand:+ start:655 stop:882 length:228 start_codon:yes stop_codon:yes gene_type:complete